MEDTHGGLLRQIVHFGLIKVLILIVMEDTHGESRRISP